MAMFRARLLPNVAAPAQSAGKTNFVRRTPDGRCGLRFLSRQWARVSCEPYRPAERQRGGRFAKRCDAMRTLDKCPRLGGEGSSVLRTSRGYDPRGVR